MLQAMGSQRVGHDLATEQQQISDLDYDIEGMYINFVKDKAGRND